MTRVFRNHKVTMYVELPTFRLLDWGFDLRFRRFAEAKEKQRFEVAKEKQTTSSFRNLRSKQNLWKITVNLHSAVQMYLQHAASYPTPPHSLPPKIRMSWVRAHTLLWERDHYSIRKGGGGENKPMYHTLLWSKHETRLQQWKRNIHAHLNRVLFVPHPLIISNE